MGQGLRLYQRSGIQALMRRSRLLHTLAPPLARLDEMSPPMSARFLQAGDLRFVPAEGERRHRVAFLTGCIMSLALAEAHRASLRVLARAGCDVHLPEHQQCCGALHVHGGARETARDLARRNIDAFDADGPRRHRGQFRRLWLDPQGVRQIARGGSPPTAIGHTPSPPRSGTSPSSS